LKTQFYPGYCTDEKAQEVIGRVWKSQNYLCDTHTACAWAVAEDYVNRTGDKTPMVVLSTASPYKFPTAVLGALEQTELTDEFRQMERLYALTGVEIPQNLTGLEQAKELHTGVCNKEDMLELVRGL
jgi:threonine synthase